MSDEINKDDDKNNDEKNKDGNKQKSDLHQ